MCGTLCGIAVWNYFATSHGKSACDGIGGTAKQLTSNASLMATEKITSLRQLIYLTGQAKIYAILILFTLVQRK